MREDLGTLGHLLDCERMPGAVSPIRLLHPETLQEAAALQAQQIGVLEGPLCVKNLYENHLDVLDHASKVKAHTLVLQVTIVSQLETRVFYHREMIWPCRVLMRSTRSHMPRCHVPPQGSEVFVQNHDFYNTIRVRVGQGSCRMANMGPSYFLPT